MAGFCVLIILSFDTSGSNKVMEASVLPTTVLDAIAVCRPCNRTKLLRVRPAPRAAVLTLTSIEMLLDTDELYVLRFPDAVAAEGWINDHADELVDKKLYLVDPAIPSPLNP